MCSNLKKNVILKKKTLYKARATQEGGKNSLVGPISTAPSHTTLGSLTCEKQMKSHIFEDECTHCVLDARKSFKKPKRMRYDAAFKLKVVHFATRVNNVLYVYTYFCVPCRFHEQRTLSPSCYC